MLRGPAESVQAIHAALAAGLAPLRAVPPMSLSEWSAEHFRLSAESSHQQGAWAAYPFQIGWMDAFSNDAIVEVTVRKSKRVGYTKTLLAFIGYNAAHRRRKQALWQPTDDDRDSFVKSELDPMLRDVSAVAAVQAGGKEATLKLKSFLGSVLHTLGAKAARAFRRITVDVAMLDEVDAMDMQVEKTIDPITGARGRLEGAPFPKLIAGSTPRRKGLSHIEYREANADAVMLYEITCPHCSAEHPLMHGRLRDESTKTGMQWDGDDIATVRHVCPHCHEPITQGEYLRAWVGVWVSRCGLWRYGPDRTWRAPDGTAIAPPAHVAWVIWTAYSPQRSWPDIVREHLEASTKAKAGDTAPLEGFVNETLAELWEEKFDGHDEHVLARRAEAYHLRSVPMGGLVLVAGVDTQDNRWEVVVWAIGRGEEMWVVDYAVIYGDPADEREWQTKLDPYLQGTFGHQAGTAMKLEAAAVDTGGHHTHQAYNFCRQRERRRVFAVRGDPAPSKMVKGKAAPQDVNWRGKVIKRGVRLWYVGTDTAKDLLHGRLQVVRPGPGYVHFPTGLPPEFFSGLTAEVRVPQRTARGSDYRWVNQHRRRNEPLDCTVYAIWCTHQLGLHLYTGKMWDRLESAVQPPNRDLFSDPPPNAASGAALVPEPAAMVEPEAPASAPAQPAEMPAPPARRRRQASTGRIGGMNPAWR